MDDTLESIYLSIQREIKLIHGVDIDITLIHRIVLHQTLFLKEAVEVMNSIRLPYIGNIRPVSKSIEKHYEKGILTVNTNTHLYNMLKSKR